MTVKSRFWVGVDLGQAHDFTAIAVLERVEKKGTWDPVAFAWRKVVALQLRHLERVALGTPYTEVAQRAAQVTHAPQLAGCCELVVDATGVGRPVVDLLRKERPSGNVIPVTITGGSTEGSSDGYYRVPKRALISGLQILLQKGALQIASKLRYSQMLVKEMTEMRVKVTCSGNEEFEAWREGAHDDLVLAVALACWRAQKCFPSEPAGEAAYWLYPFGMAYGEGPRGACGTGQSPWDILL